MPLEMQTTTASEPNSPIPQRSTNGRCAGANVSRTNLRTTDRFAETSAVPGTGVSVAGQRNLGNSFVVDGLFTIDPANTRYSPFIGFTPLEVRGDTPLAWEVSPADVKPLQTERVPSGCKVTLNEFGLTRAVIFTADNNQGGMLVHLQDQTAKKRKIAAQWGITLPLEPDPHALSDFLEQRKQADPLHFPDLSLAVVKLMGPGEYTIVRSPEPWPKPSVPR